MFRAGLLAGPMKNDFQECRTGFAVCEPEFLWKTVLPDKRPILKAVAFEEDGKIEKCMSSGFSGVYILKNTIRAVR